MRRDVLLIVMLIAVAAAAAADPNLIEKEMTFTVDAGRNDCFYQPVKAGQTIDLEYQVIDGGHGDLDISFTLADPTGQILYADYKKSDNVHRHWATAPGDYAICFDNTISRFNRKTVFLELLVEAATAADGTHVDDEDGGRDEAGDGYRGFENFGLGGGGSWPKDLQQEAVEAYEMRIDEIRERIARVHGHLNGARTAQDMLRSFEARDRNVAEANNARVQMWSLFQIAVMVAVGALQVVMLRSLFETDAGVQTIWKRLRM